MKKIPWKVFQQRRNANLAQIIDANSLSTLDEVKKYLENYWVAAPSQEEYDEALTRTKKYASSSEGEVVEPVVSQKPSAKKTSRRSTKKTSAPRKVSKKPEENPDEVWEDAQEGAYQSKSTAPKKKPSTRKTSTRKSTAKKSS